MDNFLEKDLSYKLIGIFINISKEFGYLLKEEAYYNLLKTEFVKNKISYLQQPGIKLYNPSDNSLLDCYYSDFLIENKIILELKSQNQIYHDHINQLIKYLSLSDYELGFIVNFGVPKVQIIRRVFTKERKKYLLK
jgi:GxxExxY protein